MCSWAGCSLHKGAQASGLNEICGLMQLHVSEGTLSLVNPELLCGSCLPPRETQTPSEPRKGQDVGKQTG